MLADICCGRTRADFDDIAFFYQTGQSSFYRSLTDIRAAFHKILFADFPQCLGDNGFDTVWLGNLFGYQVLNPVFEFIICFYDEYEMLTSYAEKWAEKDAADAAWKEARQKLDDALIARYAALSVEEIKELLFEKKWMGKLSADICDAFDQVLNSLSSRVLLIAKRYEHTLGEIEEKTERSHQAVKDALERMGYRW